MPCKCNTARRDPECTIPHTLSELEVGMAFPALDREHSSEFTGELADCREIYKTLDELLKGVGLLSLGQITSRPILHKAVDQAMLVLDRAIKEGRYVVQQ